jgi:Ni/Fe-hydrogenase 1 B-type cytochrome subunit
MGKQGAGPKQNTVRRVLIWPWTVRLIHAVLGLSGLILLLTGWLLDSGLVLNDRLYQVLLDDLHLPAGHLLGVALVARLYLLVADDGVAGFASLMPDRRWPGKALEMVRFYASFGRTPLPGYFAHNGLWAPIYLLMFVLLLLSLIGGLMLELPALRGLFGWSSDALLRFHVALFEPIAVLVVAHIGTSLLHDVRGAGADVSGMLNGSRVFEVSETRQSTQSTDVDGIRPEDIGLWRPEKKE